jgi:hypothetical protein
VIAVPPDYDVMQILLREGAEPSSQH